MTTSNAQNLLGFVQKISKTGDVSAITLESKLFEEGILTSMNILDLIGYVEEGTGQTLSDDQLVMANFQTVSKILNTFYHD
jgi:acyl carrier protein